MRSTGYVSVVSAADHISVRSPVSHRVRDGGPGPERLGHGPDRRRSDFPGQGRRGYLLERTPPGSRDARAGLRSRFAFGLA